MKPSDLESGSGRIRLALEDLHTAWLDTSDEWRDDVARKFAENHLEPLLPVIKTSLDAVSRMDLLLRQAQRDLLE
jgi:hypothetical protein